MTGFKNVIAGLEHFPSHVAAWFTDNDNLIPASLKSAFAELAAFEKANAKEQVKAIEGAAVDAFEAKRATGAKVGASIEAGVAAAFATVIGDVKDLSTQAMTIWVSGLAK